MSILKSFAVWTVCVALAALLFFVYGKEAVQAVSSWPNWLKGLKPNQWAGVAIIACGFIYFSKVIIPAFSYGVVKTFGRPTRRILDHGLHFIIPVVQSVQLIKYEGRTTPIEESFFAEDNREVKVRGTVLWRPDKALLTGVFLQRSEDAITSGLKETVEGAIGNLTGLKQSREFIRARRAAELLINALLRLREEELEAFGFRGKTPDECVEICKDPALALKLRRHLQLVDDPNKKDTEPEERSDAETLYGIQILNFALGDIDFSEASRKTLEAATQAVDTVKAKQKIQEAKLAMIRELKGQGLSPREALNAAEITLGQATKDVKSFEGLPTSINLGLGSAPQAPAPTAPPAPKAP